MVIMYDSIQVSAIPADAKAVAGYVGGSWPDFSPLVKRFPTALHKSVAVNSGEDADILDVETGDASPSQAPAWVNRQLSRGLKLPGIYANASTMTAVQTALNAAKIARTNYVLWVASWNNTADVPTGFEAHQFIDHGPNGENIDISACDPSFWHTAPSPPAVNPPHYDWFSTGPFPSQWGDLDERGVVESYDGARKHPLIYKLFLLTLEAKLLFLANRVRFEAVSQPNADGTPSNGVDHRGWRYQGLIHRSQGQRFV